MLPVRLVFVQITFNMIFVTASARLSVMPLHLNILRIILKVFISMDPKSFVPHVCYWFYICTSPIFILIQNYYKNC